MRAEIIRVGIGAPLSGNGSALGREMTQAIELALDETNATGGIGGTRVIAVPQDDKGDEAAGLEVARSFACDQALLAVIGHYNSNVTLCVAPIYQDAGLPMISPIVSNPKLTDSGWTRVFRFTNRDDETAAALATHLVRHIGKRRAAVVATRTIYGRSMSEQFTCAFKAIGGEVIKFLEVDEGEKNFESLVRGLPTDFDMLFYGGTFEGAPLLKAMRSHGLRQLFAAGDGCWDSINFLEPAGADAMSGEGVLVLSACCELGKVAGSREFAERYNARYGPILNYAVNSYDAAMTLVMALRSAQQVDHGVLDRPHLWKALRPIKRQGIAFPRATQWDMKGDNAAAVTALHVVKAGKFCQVDMLPQRRSSK
jgi:branched-chain amino acid transport system substrate-binding protein